MTLHDIETELSELETICKALNFICLKVDDPTSTAADLATIAEEKASRAYEAMKNRNQTLKDPWKLWTIQDPEGRRTFPSDRSNTSTQRSAGETKAYYNPEA